MSKTNYIVRKYVGNIETDDMAHYEPFAKLCGDKDFEGEQIYITAKTTSNWAEESSHISIEDVEKILVRLKKKKANYVEIMFHEDHDNYVFNGVILTKASQEDIDKFNEKNDKSSKKAIEEKRAELKKELKKIDEELDGNSK